MDRKLPNVTLPYQVDQSNLALGHRPHRDHTCQPRGAQIVFDGDPDAGSGALEGLIVAITLALTILLVVLARGQWQRAEQSGGSIPAIAPRCASRLADRDAKWS